MELYRGYLGVKKGYVGVIYWSYIGEIWGTPKASSEYSGFYMCSSQNCWPVACIICCPTECALYGEVLLAIGYRKVYRDYRVYEGIIVG